MNQLDLDVAIIVKQLKERALTSPWVPLGIPPREHHHVFPNGLSICFTLDILPGARFWHLSIARISGGPTREEIDFWRHVFFEEQPTVEWPSRLLGSSGRHYYWGYKEEAWPS